MSALGGDLVGLAEIAYLATWAHNLDYTSVSQMKNRYDRCHILAQLHTQLYYTADILAFLQTDA